MAVSIFTPEGLLYICRSVGLDNGYTDTFTFQSKAEQTQFFQSKATVTIDHMGPVRLGEPIRVPRNANYLYDCDYLMFQNTNYGSKWFYAFITEIRWVGINLCEVFYEIDVIQTWYFDMVFPRMFIEREHANHDVAGDNLIEEGLETGDHMLSPSSVSWQFTSWAYLLWTSFSSDSTQEYSDLGGIFSGLYCTRYGSASALNSRIQAIVSQGKGDGIIAITMFPDNLLTNASPPQPQTGTITKTIQPTLSGEVGGYQPRNKKLLTSPYRYLSLSNQNGNIGIFKIEYFSEAPTNSAVTVDFKIAIDLTPTPTAVAIPQNYMGLNDRWDYGVALSDFPQCAWASDVYQAWLAQNSSRLSTAYNNMSIDFIQTAVNSGISFIGNTLSNPGTVLGNAVNSLQTTVNGGVDTYQNIQKMLAVQKDIQVLPPQAHGAPSSYVQISQGEKGYILSVQYIREEIAQSLDSYFDLYGYKTLQVKTPNINGRMSWNYVKTVGATILGSAPSYIESAVESIFDKGIRFWHGDYIGQYFRQNSIAAPIDAKQVNGEANFIKLDGTTYDTLEEASL